MVLGFWVGYIIFVSYVENGNDCVCFIGFDKIKRGDVNEDVVEGLYIVGI